jgi:hypothetical protein
VTTPPDDTTPVAEGSYDWWRTEVAARDADLERLRAELAESEQIRLKLGQTIAAFPDARDAANLAHARAQRDTLQAELAEADIELNEALNHNDDNCSVVAERDRLQSAIEKLSARHQPKLVPGVRSCGQHSPKGVCNNCETYEARVCSNLTCCEGSMVEPGTEAEGDWDSTAMGHHPYTGEPCTACNGTGKAAGWLDRLAAASLAAAREKFGPETTPDAPTEETEPDD